MCGIAGIIGSYESNELRNKALIISDSFKHRGPDDAGLEIFNLAQKKKLALIHRRLSIIDTSNLGHQPMLDDVNGNWIIFNGEIYNFIEIKNELKCFGYKFKSESDTEILLKGYDKWGPEILNKVEGMFAFSIWDSRKKQLFMAVDPLGIKPLYWSNSENLFCFSSEVRSLLKSNTIKKEINISAIDNFLAYGSVHGTDTIIKNLNILQAGNYMIIDHNGQILQHKQYWKTNFKNKTNIKKKLIVEDLSNALEKVTKQHLISDVPIGLFLSGGIDSTALAYFSSKNIDNLKTFSVSFEEKNFSEGKFAKETADIFNIDHTELILNSQKLKILIKDAINSLDQPSIDGTNVYVISKLVNESGIKVALSGQGGDEIFGGYSTFANIPIGLKTEKYLSLVPDSLRQLTKTIFSSTFDYNRKVPSKINQLLSKKHDLLDLYLLLRQVLPFKNRREVLPGSSFKYNAINKKNLNYFKKEIKDLTNFDAISFLELNLYLGQTLLRDGDVMGMANSLEIRVPYLDRRIVKIVASMPDEYKIDRKKPKPLILEAANGGVRDNIWKKTKQGFTFPWEKWLKNDLKYLGIEAFDDSKLWTKLGFNHFEVKKIWELFLQGNKEISWVRIWTFIVLREWVNNNVYS